MVYADTQSVSLSGENSVFSEQEGNPGTFGAESPEKSPERCSACVPEKKDTMNIRAEKFPHPPDKRKTAAPAGTGHGGKAEFRNDNANPTGARKQGTPDHFLNGGRAADG